MATISTRAAAFANPLPDVLTDEELRMGARARAVCCAVAIGVDLFIYYSFRGSPSVNQPVLRAFAMVNIPLLLLHGLASLVGQAWLKRPWRGYNDIGPVIEIFTVVVWVQVTGSVSSYFIMFGPMLVGIHRGYWGYRAGIISCAALMGLHGGAFVLEELGVLRPSSIFVEAGGIYSLPHFRQAAILSIMSIHFGAFVGANFVINQLRRKDRALSEAQRELALVGEGVRHGRLSGERLGRQLLGELLGRGGMGEVYAARRDDGSEVAVKVLHPHLSDDLTVFERFQREADVAEKLPGDHCPKLVEVARAPQGFPYIVMELLRGEDLGAYLRRRGPLPLGEAVRLVQPIARALDAMHDAGVVHRDIKPANIFLLQSSASGAPAVKLLDFGVAKLREITSTLTQDSSALGTPGFMSPEQARGRVDEIGPPTDVFALGVVLYRALTGILPFAAGNALAAIDQVCNAHPMAPSRVVATLPADVDCVVAIALAKRVADRYPRAGELCRALELAATSALPETARARAAALAPADAEAATLAHSG
ncbi:MAG TPA: serine/threonine-protein kinase [Kofleriaceae bacterium]|nr:serine/threonine-protein kinase [Kofleriaceae bacterium]